MPLQFGRAASGDGRLLLNLDTGAAGSCAVEVLDAATRRPLPGLSLEQAVPIVANDVDAAPQWKNASALKGVAGRRVRLRFVLQASKLFGFRFVANAAEATASYLDEAGKQTSLRHKTDDCTNQSPRVTVWWKPEAPALDIKIFRFRLSGADMARLSAVSAAVKSDDELSSSAFYQFEQESDLGVDTAGSWLQDKLVEN